MHISIANKKKCVRRLKTSPIFRLDYEKCLMYSNMRHYEIKYWPFLVFIHFFIRMTSPIKITYAISAKTLDELPLSSNSKNHYLPHHEKKPNRQLCSVPCGYNFGRNGRGIPYICRHGAHCKFNHDEDFFMSFYRLSRCHFFEDCGSYVMRNNQSGTCKKCKFLVSLYEE